MKLDYNFKLDNDNQDIQKWMSFLYALNMALKLFALNYALMQGIKKASVSGDTTLKNSDKKGK